MALSQPVEGAGSIRIQVKGVVVGGQSQWKVQVYISVEGVVVGGLTSVEGAGFGVVGGLSQPVEGAGSIRI